MSKSLKAIAETTIRNRAAKGIHYAEGTAEAMIKAAMVQESALAKIAVMERVLAEADRV